MRLLPNLLLLSIGPGTELPRRFIVLGGAQNRLKAADKMSSEIHIESGAVRNGRFTNRHPEGGRMKSNCQRVHSRTKIMPFHSMKVRINEVRMPQLPINE